MIDLVNGRHVGSTITKSSYVWIYGSEKSIEGLPEGLIFDIHDGGSDTVIQIEIIKDGFGEWLQSEDPEDALGTS